MRRLCRAHTGCPAPGAGAGHTGRTSRPRQQPWDNAAERRRREEGEEEEEERRRRRRTDDNDAEADQEVEGTENETELIKSTAIDATKMARIRTKAF
mgnify:CR=1 FL=1